jgi:uncharacterized protein (TIGR03435 family)
MSLAGLLMLSWSAALGQVFDVASVKPSAPSNAFPAGGGGPGTPDPERVHMENMPMRSLIMTAYSLAPYQLSGPSWLANEKYDIDAKVPPGATREQTSVMLQNLLAERFGLRVHRETRDFTGYELAIARSGPKLKEPEPPSPALAATLAAGGRGPMKMRKDQDGLPELEPGANAMGMATTPGGNRLSARGQLLSRLVLALENDLGEPVRDRTGLTGKYDFNLTYSPVRPVAAAPPRADAPADGPSQRPPDLFTALEEQLGLKLEHKKIPVDVLVIDRLEKVPAAN